MLSVQYKVSTASETWLPQLSRPSTTFCHRTWASGAVHLGRGVLALVKAR